ncbi:MAG: bifunctional diguanylate cyclase/phosphohydrolase [Solirubrobacteraceae bacterium]
MRADVRRGMLRVRHALPEGGSLPLEDWRRRHAGITALLWLNVVGVLIYALSDGRASLVHRIDSAIALSVFAVLAGTPRLSRKLRTICASLGLLIAAALFIHDSGGLLEWHFYFFLLIIVLTLYEDWMPFLLAVGFVLIHHGVLGTLEPHGVFDRADEWAHPWKWAAIHAAFVAGAGVAALVTWRLNEDVRAEMRAAHEQLAQASETDSLTGLGNRRKLMSDLDEIFATGDSTVLVILDLNGFKSYNDTFGHPAGDALLARVGTRLHAAVTGCGSAYRLGGDEFCSIWHGPATAGATPELASAAALCERGEGFAITGSYGAVAIPGEASTAELALHMADRRLYSHKGSSRASSSVQSKDVLRQALAELRPELACHADSVMTLAEEVAQTIGLAPHLIEQVRQAAQLHDIGKIAIPDSLLNKPGQLTAVERDFIHRHPAIGERIINAAPDLTQVASLVRSSHERYDGTGYPDGIRGDEIPMGARIVAVCDAYDALTSERPHQPQMDPTEALEEIRCHSGTQFDPIVLAAFEVALGHSAVACVSEHAPTLHMRRSNPTPVLQLSASRRPSPAG